MLFLLLFFLQICISLILYFFKYLKLYDSDLIPGVAILEGSKNRKSNKKQTKLPNKTGFSYSRIGGHVLGIHFVIYLEF